MGDEDRWLPLRLDHQARIITAEAAMTAAARTAVRTWLSHARTAALPTLTAAAVLPPDPGALAGTGQAWMDAVTAHLLPAAAATFDTAAAATGADVDLIRLEQLKDEYLAALPNRLARVPDEVWQQVTATITDLTGQGASIPTIRDAVDELLGEHRWDDRAVTIARTETVGAYNAGTLSAWLTAAALLGEATDKVWVATHDERTRGDHRHADGQRAPLDGNFRVGGVPMRFPGDPAAPPGQVVNCRCTMIEIPSDEPLPDVPQHPWPTPAADDRPAVTAAAARTDTTNDGDASGTAPQEGDTLMQGWEGTLAPLGQMSGDRRIFAPDGEWSFRDLPLPLRWAREDAPGHEGAVTIGRITAGAVEDGELTGSGDFIGAVPETAEALELLQAGVLYPSVDLDDFDWTYTDANGLPLEEMSDEQFDAFLEAGEEPYMMVTRGRVMAVTLVGTQAFPQAHITLTDAPDPEGQEAEVQAEPVAASGPPRTAAPLYPPRAWFDDPQLPELTPVTVTADGRVYGHLADNDCHLSFLPGQQCVLPPADGGFDWFHRPEILTAEGDHVAVGHITAGTGHADLAASASSAVDHYDNTGTQVAVVRAGRDQHGIYIAGSLVPEATPAQAQLLRRSPLSGDWRVIGGQRQLVAALCVNVGGFPVVRGRTSGGRAVSLQASGWTGWRPSTRANAKSMVLADSATLNAAVQRAVAAGFAAQRQADARRAEADHLAASIGLTTAGRI